MISIDTTEARPILPESHYTVAWICALPVERIAAWAMLDVAHDGPSEVHQDDENTYQLGSIGKHNIVITCLPLGCYGTVNAAVAAIQMKLTFPSLKIFLLVGIGGGIPSACHDIRLGDIVISKPQNSFGGVVQYDLGKTGKGGHFERVGSLNKPPQQLLNAIAAIKAAHDSGQGKENIPGYISEVHKKHTDLKELYGYKGQENDQLYKPDYEHEGGLNCESCVATGLVQRRPRETSNPVIHYGTIASGNQVMKHGLTRDRIGNDSGALCFEMEAAGLMDHCPCLVIRGICDYSDSHKNKVWQPYAALAAAAYAKELLYSITPSAVSLEPSQHVKEIIFDIPRILHPRFSGRQEYLDRIHCLFHLAKASSSAGTIISIFGIPGVGKSQLSLKYAMDNKNEYDYGFYSVGNTIHHWLCSCDSIVQALRLPESESKEQDQKLHALNRWLSNSRNWILVIDDVALPVVDTLRKTLPQHLGGHVLLSTRDKHIAHEFSPPGFCVQLSEMEPAEGKELVLKVSNRQGDNAEIAEKISQQLGGLPLPLEQGTTYAVQHFWDLNTLYYNLQESKLGIIKDPVENPHHVDVVRTLEMALAGLKEAHIDLLNLVLMMHPQSLPLQLLIDGGSSLTYSSCMNLSKAKEWVAQFWHHWRSFKKPKFITKPTRTDQEESLKPNQSTRHRIFRNLCNVFQSKLELDRAILILEKSSVLRRAENGSIWVHDLFKEVLLSKLEDSRRNEYLRYTAQIVCHGFPDPFDHRMWAKCNTYLPHALEVMESLDKFGLHNADSLYTMILIQKYLTSSGRYNQSLALLERSLLISDSLLGADHPFSFQIIHDIATVLEKQNRLDESLECYRRALAGLEGSLSKKEAAFRPLFTNDILTDAERDKRYDDTMQLCRKILSKFERNKKLKDESSKLVAIYNIAGIFSAQKRFDEAVVLYRRALLAQENISGSEDRAVLESATGLAVALRQKGEWDEALKFYRQILKTQLKLYGEDHPMTGNTIYNMGVALAYQDKFDEAMELCEKLLSRQENIVGRLHPQVLDTVNLMARILHEQGRYVESRCLYERVLSGREILLGKDHPLIAQTVKDIQTSDKYLSCHNQKQHKAENFVEQDLHERVELDSTYLAQNTIATPIPPIAPPDLQTFFIP
ncbi:hypothetical protein TWF730_010094 [Orbilia blumenaviensis]|uniref:NB-ARC domain-containing protein n=1 Tax=Orbilia blumenaviensis TaxID=1796055 RepID=A0AAV9UWP8_9PEZI